MKTNKKVIAKCGREGVFATAGLEFKRHLAFDPDGNVSVVTTAIVAINNFISDLVILRGTSKCCVKDVEKGRYNGKYGVEMALHRALKSQPGWVQAIIWENWRKFQEENNIVFENDVSAIAITEVFESIVFLFEAA